RLLLCPHRRCAHAALQQRHFSDRRAAVAHVNAMSSPPELFPLEHLQSPAFEHEQKPRLLAFLYQDIARAQHSQHHARRKPPDFLLGEPLEQTSGSPSIPRMTARKRDSSE